MIEYRKSTIDDIDELLIARRDFWRDVGSVKNEEDESALLGFTREFLLSSLSDGSFIQWIALDGGRIVGTIGLSMFPLPPNSRRMSGKSAYISNMFTYPEHRKQGIASKLFALTVDSAKEAGCREIWLDSTDMGISIYEQYGFRRNENSMNYYVT